MSKIATILVGTAARGARARRTIAHSPSFSGSQTADDDDGRPMTSLPAGGFLTG